MENSLELIELLHGTNGPYCMGSTPKRNGLELVYSYQSLQSLEGLVANFYLSYPQFTFTGTITISLLWEGEWVNPFGISSRLTVRRLGLALGINVADLVPSFGITGAISVDVPSATGKDPIDVELTLCIDPSTPDKTVFELHFTRLLLEDVINLFAGKPVDLPEKLAEVGFPDEVQIYFSLAGNPDCFGKR